MRLLKVCLATLPGASSFWWTCLTPSHAPPPSRILVRVTAPSGTLSSTKSSLRATEEASAERSQVPAAARGGARI